MERGRKNNSEEGMVEGREKAEREKQSVHGCIGTSGMHLWHGSWPREKRAHTTIIQLGKKEQEEETRRRRRRRSKEDSLRPH